MSSRVSLCCLLALGCSGETLEPRAQTLLYIDTDAPLLGQLSTSSDAPFAIAVDTLRIDRLDDAGAPVETRELVVPAESDWPVSFGIVATSKVRFRLRAFRADNAQAAADGTLTPSPGVAIDRLLEVTPGSAFERWQLTLSADCFNAPANFRGSWSTCVDSGQLQGPVSAGLSPRAAAGASATQAGKNAHAQTLPCQGQPPAGSVCIPGGASVLGEERLRLLASTTDESPAPVRAYAVSPFFLDRLEYTVGRLRQAIKSGKVTTVEPERRDPTLELQQLCSYVGPSDAASDDLPLNCVSFETARALCQLAGGDLPSEAEWEFAARGRGYAYSFPWGDDYPLCCTADLERTVAGGSKTFCPGSGIEPVGSHPTAGACPTNDVSRDGVLDLGGSVTEWTLDTFRAYDDACWAERGFLQDPACNDPTASAHTGRGSYYNAGRSTAYAARRSQGFVGATVGFRCAYADGVAP
ncbi:MAG TPA: SUMF1/EgtB/PvdO family nonheme iron enzyme [Polyangiaceae bacterium]|nr:SUMF1/EgtB/PvdO family nonheme iron enzyme [Polyangiaceae bacterium]